MPPNDISDIVRSVYQLMFFRSCKAKRALARAVYEMSLTYNRVHILIEALVLAEYEQNDERHVDVM